MREVSVTTRRRTLPMPSVPVKERRWPTRNSELVRLLLAWIDGHLSHPEASPSLSAFENVLLGEGGEDELPEADRRVASELRSALLQERARQEGRLSSAERLLPADAPPELRAAFADPEPLDRILGWWDLELGWHPGLAGLTYTECKATTLSLNGLLPWEIAQHEDMVSRRRRRAGETLPVEAVYVFLSRSAKKLGALFLGASVDDTKEGDVEASTSHFDHDTTGSLGR